MVSALIGGGFMGDTHARALRAAGIAIAGVASSTPERARQASNQLGLDHAYESVSDLVSDPRVTVVHVLSPNSVHREQVALAIEAGKHVVCEKPLAMTAAEATELEELRHRRGVVGAIPFVYRFHPMLRQARHLIHSGATGRVLGVRGQYLQDWLLDPEQTNWRVDSAKGGASRVFADIGIHLCDAIEFVTGQRITRLVAAGDTVYATRAGHPVDTEDAVSLVAQLDGGALVSAMVSQVAAGHKNDLVIDVHAEVESLRFSQERPDELWRGRPLESAVMMRDPNVLAPEAAAYARLPGGHPEGYFDAFVSFMRDVLRAAAGEMPAGLPTFVDGVRAAHLTEAVLGSVASGSWVSVPPVAN
jgi:predicted dehydrogenase